MPPPPSWPVERWQVIERVLGQDGPLPAEIRRYLWDIANLLNQLADDERLTPEQAAELVPSVIGLTGQAIRAYREERPALAAGGAFEILKQGLGLKRGEVKNLASDLAKVANLSTRQVYRGAARWRARKEK